MAGVPPNPPPAGPFLGEYAVPDINVDTSEIRIPSRRLTRPTAGIWALENEVLRSLPIAKQLFYEKLVKDGYHSGFRLDPAFGTPKMVVPMLFQPETIILGNRDLRTFIYALGKFAKSVQDPATQTKSRSFLLLTQAQIL
jgi:hypothetical protein